MTEAPPGPASRLSRALTSWRTASVSILSFSSGLPLGLLWISLPDWMRKSGIDIRVVGLITLIQAPWSFKMLWSPLMDRWMPPFLGRRRGWILLSQFGLIALTLVLGGAATRPDAIWVLFGVALALAFVAASQDIAVDAYAVDVLRPEEQALAVGARTAIYRAAMYIAGSLTITVAAWISWPMAVAILAALYLPLLPVTWFAPEPETKNERPIHLRAAIWEPFVELLARHRAIEILAFVVFYKLADQLAQSLQRPFLVDMHYSDFDRGVALGTVGLIGTIAGTFVGGALTAVLGLGHSLWLFGLLQLFSNLGFVWVSLSGVDRPLMYGAMGFEALTSGLGMGAFGVLLLRLTERRFSATQYALFSSLFGLPRLIAGPITGVTVDALGWTTFFWGTLVAGLPGLLLLARFVPLGVREPTLAVVPLGRPPRGARQILLWAIPVAFVAFACGLAVSATLDALKLRRSGAEFDWLAALWPLLAPTTPAAWITVLGALAFAAVVGLFTAAARR